MDSRWQITHFLKPIANLIKKNSHQRVVRNSFSHNKNKYTATTVSKQDKLICTAVVYYHEQESCKTEHMIKVFREKFSAVNLY